jgi:hypothetical protein
MAGSGVMHNSLHLLSCIGLILSLTACSTVSEALQPDSAETFYIPPTAPGKISPPIVLTPTSSSNLSTSPPETSPSATPECINDLIFLEDLTIPDQTIVSPDATLDKRWKVENNGSCNWDDRYRIKSVSDSKLDTLTEQALYPARSGTQATIRILFDAPSEPGTYQSAWQAFSPLGEPFGEPFYIEIAVEIP